jgi:hypothetical protein
MKWENYYLDLVVVNSLPERESQTIHKYYMDMMHSFCDGRENLGRSIFLTLQSAGYLKEVRGEKIDKLLS